MLLTLAKLVPEPQVLRFPLGMTLTELSAALPGIEPTIEDSSWIDTMDYRFQLPDYRLIAHVHDRIIKGFIHDTVRYRSWPVLKIKKLGCFLKIYGEGSRFRFIVDNGSGAIYRSADGRIRAAYSYLDIFSVSLFEIKRKESEQTDAANSRASGTSGTADADASPPPEASGDS